MPCTTPTITQRMRDPRTLRRDKQAVRQVLLLWKDYDARRMQRDEDVEEALTAEFMARLKTV